MVQAFGRLPYLLLHKILHLLWIGSLLAPFSVLAVYAVSAYGTDIDLV
ncbi:MAG: hypothetical protein OSB26_04425 [Woeseiaceae bacterium]|nr:hypothetical protein [Woeseiaceae bacterium]